MPRTPFAIMLTMMSFLALPITHAYAQDSASDATTPMDKALGNQVPPSDNTLSNDEVRELKHQSAGDAPATTASGDTAPTVSGTTPVYKTKSGSAAQSEGGVVTPQ